MSKVLDYYNASGSERKIIDINNEWYKSYKQKKYDKLSAKAIYLIRALSKLIISKSYVQELKTNKVLLELFLMLLALSKKCVKEDLKIEKITFQVLLNLGFKKTSLKLAIRKLCKMKIVNFENGIITLKRKNLRRKNEQYFVIKKEDNIKLFLLNGLETALMHINLKFKSKKLNGKRFTIKRNQTKIYYQTGYFSRFGWSRHKIYKLRKNVCKYLLVSFNQVFNVVRENFKVFEEKTYRGFCYKKFVGWGFSTKVYMLMRI
ncbi:hypothetical protein DIE66_00490 [Mycoplasmopsis arginini]|uniref:MAGa4850 family ICE element protein n=1 Tax=Mycoplasmopsis arginini TaxID=2094 RepID=UPI000D6110BB|nr:hypothetical protein [Mycoplasmopsis arginini]PWC09102.1 hypothetical protein DIE66_00490 [Mycoplasmopsis arginini]